MPEDTNCANGRHTAKKLPRGKGRPFVKGEDPRRNLKGRPHTFDELRAVAQRIAHETEEREGNRATVIENILHEWRESPEPTLQKAFVEYAFGKVPDKLETTGLENKPVVFLHYAHERNGTEERSRN